jgi:hypothetical protein
MRYAFLFNITGTFCAFYYNAMTVTVVVLNLKQTKLMKSQKKGKHHVIYDYAFMIIK